jgi:hypothetical protein
MAVATMVKPPVGTGWWYRTEAEAAVESAMMVSIIFGFCGSLVSSMNT